MLFGLVFFLWGLAGWDLSAPDEPRYALVAREMLQSGDFLFPHRNQKPYPDKPPLFFWSIAAATGFQGGEVTAFSARLPSALAALLCLLLLYQALRNNGENEALAAASVLVLASGARFMLQAHMAQIDMLLCLLTTAATLHGFALMRGTGGSQWQIGLLLGLAILAKGPVGYLIPLGTWLLYALLFHGEGMGQGLSRLPKRALLWGLLPPLLWLIGLALEVAARGEWDYFKNLLFQQTLVRYLQPWHHHKGVTYFLQTLLLDFFPWSLPLLATLPFTRRQRASLSELQRLCWACVVFVLLFFSLSKGKRNLYILPLYPFAAILVAHGLVQWRARPAFRLATYTSLSLLTIAGLALLALGCGLWLPKRLQDLGLVLPRLSLLLAGLALPAILVFTLLRQQIRWAPLAAMLTLNLLLFQSILPWISPLRSPRSFCQDLERKIHQSGQPQRPLAMVDFREAYRFFADRPVVELTTAPDQKAHPKLLGIPDVPTFWRQEPSAWILFRSADLAEYQRLRPDFPATVEILRQRVSDEEMLVLALADPSAKQQN